jgi:very-short-patch-repair endonuclease
MERRTFRVDPQLVELARGMRRKSAPAEQKLWYCLRDRRLNGFKFRRQVGIDRYIADFYCAQLKLIVEIDGESHCGNEREDQRRTETLNTLGLGVIRFSNVDVHENLEGVLLSILGECAKRSNSPLGPSPPPSPPSTRERE